MKQTILSFLLALLPLAASADAVEIDGIYYNLVSKLKTAEVTRNPNKYTGTVTIPKTVTYNDVTYNVTSIGNLAFEDCSGLTSITIPNSVTSIGSSAFYGCSVLTSITIPNSVTNIGLEAFYGCKDLKTVLISDLEAWCYISFSNSSANPLSYAKHLYLNGEEINNIVIPNTVTSIGRFAFYSCSGLTSISIPNSVTSIGDYAFQYCSSLTSVIIPNSVTSIGIQAFYGCI